MNKGLIYGIGGVSLAFLIGGVVLFLRNRKSQDSEQKTDTKPEKYSSTSKNIDTSSIDVLSKNLGVKVSSNGTINVPFNSKKNTIQFYSNGRFSVNDSTTKKLIKKGSWADGGTKLTPDGGKLISSGSVWNNIGKLI